MSYFSDLSPYSYRELRQGDGRPVASVGWLDNVHPFSTGQVSEEFVARLLVLCVWRQVEVTRGAFPCPICGASEADGLLYAETAGRRAVLGHSEIDVGSPASIYRAPNLVYHYVTAHGYLPPQGFVEAVLTTSDAVLSERERLEWASSQQRSEEVSPINAVMSLKPLSLGGLRWAPPSGTRALRVAFGIDSNRDVSVRIESLDGAPLKAGDHDRPVRLVFDSDEDAADVTLAATFSLRYGDIVGSGAVSVTQEV